MTVTNTIKKNGAILAIIVTSMDVSKGVQFVTPKEFPLQYGFQKRNIGENVKPHEHIPFNNIESLEAQEIIIVHKGKMSVDLYNDNKLVEGVIINENQAIILNCPHSVKFLEETIISEVKQGPYRERIHEKRELAI